MRRASTTKVSSRNVTVGARITLVTGTSSSNFFPIRRKSASEITPDRRCLFKTPTTQGACLRSSRRASPSVASAGRSGNSVPTRMISPTRLKRPLPSTSVVRQIFSSTPLRRMSPKASASPRAMATSGKAKFSLEVEPVPSGKHRTRRASGGTLSSWQATTNKGILRRDTEKDTSSRKCSSFPSAKANTASPGVNIQAALSRKTVRFI